MEWCLEEGSVIHEIPTEDEPRLVTVQTAARYLAVSVSTLYGWVYHRRISFVKMGRSLRFDVADLARFIEINRTESKPHQ